MQLLVPVDVGAIEADELRFKQVVVNLLTNAVKFTPAGGTISVEVTGTDDRVVLEVRDSGIGIATEDQPLVFERFFRGAAAADGAVSGSGLGLAVVKAIVDAHAGVVGVDSAEGKGTTVRVELPVRQADGGR